MYAGLDILLASHGKSRVLVAEYVFPAQAGIQ
jgi:hypothetical protein